MMVQFQLYFGFLQVPRFCPSGMDKESNTRALVLPRTSEDHELFAAEDNCIHGLWVHLALPFSESSDFVEREKKKQKPFQCRASRFQPPCQRFLGRWCGETAPSALRFGTWFIRLAQAHIHRPTHWHGTNWPLDVRELCTMSWVLGYVREYTSVPFCI